MTNKRHLRENITEAFHEQRKELLDELKAVRDGTYLSSDDIVLNPLKGTFEPDTADRAIQDMIRELDARRDELIDALTEYYRNRDVKAPGEDNE